MANRVRIPLVFTLLCLFLSLSPPAPAQASWSDHSLGVSHDKWFHVGMGMAINEVLKERKVPWIQRQLAIIAVGALKETIDRGRGGRWDAEDFGATLLGGLMPRIQLVYRF